MASENSSTFRNYVIDVLKHAIHRRVGELYNSDMRMTIDDWVEPISGELAIAVQVAIAGTSSSTAEEPTLEISTSEDFDYVEVPETWWDHFKMQYLPKRPWNMKKICTVHITNNINKVTVVHKTTKVCPHLPVDPQHDHMFFMMHDGAKTKAQV